MSRRRRFRPFCFSGARENQVHFSRKGTKIKEKKIEERTDNVKNDDAGEEKGAAHTRTTERREKVGAGKEGTVRLGCNKH